MKMRYSILLALMLIPALALPGCGRKPDRDVNVIVYEQPRQATTTQ